MKQLKTWKDPARDKRRTFYFSVLTLVVSSAVSVFTVIYSTNAKRTAETARAERVELIVHNTNDNSPFSSGGWKPLEFSFSRHTGALGVRRQVKFATAFDGLPRVACSLSGVNMASLEGVLSSLGYVQSPDKDGLDYTSMRVDAESIGHDGFELRVSIPLRAPVVTFLRDRLKDRTLVDEELAADMRNNGEVEHTYKELTEDEIWMINFHRFIGTFDVSCVAQATLDRK